MSAKKPQKKAGASQSAEAPFAYAGLERIFHERGRLAVCTCLIAHPEGMSFTELQVACGLTDGNLSRHLRALADMDIVSIARLTGPGRPTSVCRITRSGRARFLAYVDELESVVRDVHDRAEDAQRDSRGRASPRLATTGSAHPPSGHNSTGGGSRDVAPAHRDHHGRQSPLGARNAASRSWKAIAGESSRFGEGDARLQRTERTISHGVRIFNGELEARRRRALHPFRIVLARSRATSWPD